MTTSATRRQELPGATVAEAMVTDPKRLGVRATVRDARAAFEGGHVHMLLVVDGDRLVGTLVLTDLDGAADGNLALGHAVLEGRTVAPTASAGEAMEVLRARGERRLAVVDPDGTLLGLLCLKRRRTGFCSDQDVQDRALDHG